MTFKHNLMGWAISAALVSLVLPACDDSNNNPSPSAGKGGSESSAGKSGKSGAGTGGKSGSGAAGKSGSGAGGKSGAGGGGKSGSNGGSAGSAGGGDIDAGTGDCKGAMDCFSCAPTKDEEFLNHCTDATCNPYDNSKLTKLTNGHLPAIP
jgi:hypothetical protein